MSRQAATASTHQPQPAPATARQPHLGQRLCHRRGAAAGLAHGLGGGGAHRGALPVGDGLGQGLCEVGRERGSQRGRSARAGGEQHCLYWSTLLRGVLSLDTTAQLSAPCTHQRLQSRRPPWPGPAQRRWRSRSPGPVRWQRQRRRRCPAAGGARRGGLQREAARGSGAFKRCLVEAGGLGSRPWTPGSAGRPQDRAGRTGPGPRQGGGSQAARALPSSREARRQASRGRDMASACWDKAGRRGGKEGMDGRPAAQAAFERRGGHSARRARCVRMQLSRRGGTPGDAPRPCSRLLGLWLSIHAVMGRWRALEGGSRRRRRAAASCPASVAMRAAAGCTAPPRRGPASPCFGYSVSQLTALLNQCQFFVLKSGARWFTSELCCCLCSKRNICRPLPRASSSQAGAYMAVQSGACSHSLER